MNIVLVGKTGSGKSTVCNLLTENFRYDKIITYTTRPIRVCETDGVDYHFVAKEEYDKLDLILKTEVSGYYYGVLRSDIVGAKNKIIILDRSGANSEEIRNNGFKSFYVTCPTHKRYCRCIRRGDSPMITLSRIKNETYEFDGYVPDYVCDNESEDPFVAVSYILHKVKEIEEGE